MSFVVEVCSDTKGWIQHCVVPDMAGVIKAEQELKSKGWGSASIRHQPNRLRQVNR